jgi:hypothetical protein
MITIYVISDNLVTEPNSWETHLASILQGYIEANKLDTYTIKDISSLSDIKELFNF